MDYTQSDNAKSEQALSQIMAQAPVLAGMDALSDQVWANLEEKMRQRARFRVAFFGCGAILGVLGVVWVWLSSGAILSAETVQLVSLMFSDWSIVTQNWREYFWSLTESLPVINLAAIALLVWIAGVSAWMMSRSIIKFNQHATGRA